MTQLRRFLHRLATMLRFHRAERDLGREISAHLQLLEDEFIAGGMTQADARAAARRAFGGVEQAKELQRDARGFRWLAGWPVDLKLGVRMLAKSPGLTIIGVLALAVAIGAGAAFLELTNDILHPTLNTPDADRMVGVRAWSSERRRDETSRVTTFDTWRANARLIEDLGASRPVPRHLTTPDGVTGDVEAIAISASAFRLLPVAPVVGRVLTAEDEQPAAADVAVIRHDLWQTRFGSRSDILGTVAHLGATAYTIVGIVPKEFGFPFNEEFWVPLKQTDSVFQIFGRLAEGASLTTAQAELSTLAEAAATRAEEPTVIRVSPYIDSVMDEDRGGGEALALRALNLVFILLLTICGANVATLVFARTAVREAEISVRTALGAGRARICAQLFAEALVLCGLAAGVGLVAARWVGLWVERLILESGIRALPFWWDRSLGLETLVYTLCLAVFAALIVGVVPALKATGGDVHARLRDGASGTATLRFGGVWTAVIVAQTALTVACLTAVVALSWSTYKKFVGADVIYARDRLLIAGVETGKPETSRQEYEAIADRLRREPGVDDVTFATALPGTIWEQFTFELESPALQSGADARKATEVLWSEGARVGDRFLDTVELPLRAGRAFTGPEIRLGAPVAIVDETFVRTVLGGVNPIGVRLRERPRSADAAPGPWLEIVGVVTDASLRIRNGPDDASVYRPASPGQSLRLVVRTRAAAVSMSQQVYTAARSVNPAVRLVDLRTAVQVVADDDLPARIVLRTLMVISGIALLLATSGIYALISFTLARRTREIGIRVALGASRHDIIGGVFARAFTHIGLGVGAGAIPGLVILRSLAGDVGSLPLLPAVGMTLCVCLFVISVAAASCTVPLRRALRVHPTEALRMQ